ncbi:amidohydrolase [Sporosarcina sp. PTS2304]|nr:amidohydrolase [Sporosarcina sp. PTS2304]
MSIKDGVIQWIGKEEDLQSEGERIDLKGQRVLPGFIDAHVHPLYLAKFYKQICILPPIIHSIDELIEHIEKVENEQGVGQWIEGWGFDEGKLEEKRSPTRYDLDKASTTSPIIMTRTCAHVIAVNSLALKLAGIDKNTTDPEGGKIDRDAAGEPTGVLRENAKNLIVDMMPPERIEDNVSALMELSPILLAHGITGMTEMMARTGPVDYFEMYTEASKNGMKQRTAMYYLWDDLKERNILTTANTDRQLPVCIGGVKMFADGSVSGQTALVSEPFVGKEKNSGIQMTTEEELLAGAKVAEESHTQLVIHAMGDRAIDLIVNTFHSRKGWLKEGPSIRIEHAAMPSEQALSKAAECGIAFVPQPIFLYAEIESYLKNLGEERTKHTYPIQKMLDAGIPVAFSSDAPATAWSDPVNPFVGIQSAVTRIAYNGQDTGQTERVDVETAIRLYTKGAQEVTLIPKTGQLAPGYYADFIVLDQDILTINAETIGQVQVKQTYMSGQLVYEKEK